jgi:hypothetical protein
MMKPFWTTSRLRVRSLDEPRINERDEETATEERRDRILGLVSSSVTRCAFARIVEEELIVVWIVDHQEPVPPPAIFDADAFGL